MSNKIKRLVTAIRGQQSCAERFGPVMLGYVACPKDWAARSIMRQRVMVGPYGVALRLPHGILQAYRAVIVEG